MRSFEENQWWNEHDEQQGGQIRSLSYLRAIEVAPKASIKVHNKFEALESGDDDDDHDDDDVRVFL